ncbi:hypothetical protein GBA63_09225 [Rubrobacter tropicus]|uniref:Uncharacterized protein n=1 Tax=Rubrobacter tropicus TaxID=2653851 RepID=A0A6G8Q8Q2_9ACTN|nr:hypothetical protein [Rubrobacter tropicus]QIN82812.1 hypothetical protein GBA63_09225 [Rubrobacter tropicus]
MFWRGEDGSQEAPEEGAGEGRSGPIRVTPDAPRPATILRVAGELEERGGRILELFKEIRSPLGQVVLPIHLLKDEETFFVEVATGPWDERSEREVAERAAVLRNSEHADAELELLSAYPVPEQLRFFCGRSPAALLQLDLLRLRVDRPEEAATVFREVASRHWGVDLDFEPGYLTLVEDLLMAALAADETEGDTPPVTEGLVAGVGGFLGETVRRNAGHGAAWREGEEWGEGPVVEVEGFALDPIGKANAFLRSGPEESMAFYADYVLKVLKEGEPPNARE